MKCWGWIFHDWKCVSVVTGKNESRYPMTIAGYVCTECGAVRDKAYIGHYTIEDLNAFRKEDIVE